jgi:hypothetical protein
LINSANRIHAFHKIHNLLNSPQCNMPNNEPTPSDSSVAVAEAPTEAKDANRFRFPLPFDPIRLLAGVLHRWPWILICAVIFAILGAIAGKIITRQTFSLSISLIKLRVPQTVQTSEVGQAFRPADLNDATLLATLLASEPRDKAFTLAANGVSTDQAASRVEASQQENTDIFYITYHSPISAEDAVRVSGIWADEIREYTKRLQQSEARGVLSILNKEVAALDQRIEDINNEILGFAKARNYIGGESQVAAVLGKLTQIELGLEDARSREISLREELGELTRKIRSHSPLNLRLREARDALAELRSTYTDENPLVQIKLESIAYLEEQIALLDKEAEASLESFTGSPLGNQLYLDMIAVRSRLSQATTQISRLQSQQELETDRLAEFPAIMTRYEALRSKRDSFNSELSLMSNRLKEAEIFASGSPGYWQIFQAPDPRNVIASSLIQKPMLLAVAGAVAGSALAVLLCLLRTQRSERRSALECCATTGTSLSALLPCHRDPSSAFASLWITRLSPQVTHRHGPLLIWTAALDAEDERLFWEQLSAAIKQDTGAPLDVVDISNDDLWSSSSAPDTLCWRTSAPDDAPTTLLRCNALPNASGRENLSSILYWHAVLKGEKSSLQKFSQARHLIRACLTPCSGTIVLNTPPNGKLRILADHLSLFLTKHFS